MSDVELWRSVVLQAVRDATAKVPPPLPSRPVPGYRYTLSKDTPSKASAWRKTRIKRERIRGEKSAAQAEAREWLTRCECDFPAVCEAAELCPAAIREHALWLASQGWPEQKDPF